MNVIAAETNEFGFVDKLLSHVDDVSGERRGEHAGVERAVGKITLNLFHVRIEAHGQHTVGLVEDEHPDMVQH